MGADDAGRVVLAGPDRGIAMAEVGDHSLQRVQRGRLTSRRGWVGIESGEGHGTEVLQAGAAVDQQAWLRMPGSR